jgi:ADP-ribose pyrophosphatase YjhB (NUDIX family)
MTGVSVTFPQGFRPAARALVLDGDGSVLLVRFEFPDRRVWATPGGGIEPGETVEEALRRELIEETGLHDPEIGPHLWTRQVRVEGGVGRWQGQCEVVHLVRTERFEPRPALSWERLRAEFVHELRWFTEDELLAEVAGGARMAPRALPQLLGALRADGPPAAPLHLDR